MKNNKVEKLNSLISKEKSGWLDKAKWREENESWLDLSFEIAVKILGALRKNKQSNTFPKNQKELAEAVKCSPQYINKVLKGNENLQLETITKIGNILNVSLIEVPATEVAKEEFAWASTAHFNELSYSKNKFRFPISKENLDPYKSTVQTTIEKKDISYTSLRKRFNSEEEFDNDPKSPLKVVG